MLRTQHFPAEGRLTVGFFCTVAFTKRVSASARARVPDGPAHRFFGRGADIRIVALDERLGLRYRARSVSAGPATSFCASVSRRRCRRCAARRPAGLATTDPRLRRACEDAARCAGSSIGGSGGAAASIVGNDGRRPRADPAGCGRRSRALCACSGVSRTVMNPSGLSSRTISPVSVIQAVVFKPGELHLDAERGYRRAPPSARFRDRPPSPSTGAFRSVAGSKTFH